MKAERGGSKCRQPGWFRPAFPAKRGMALILTLGILVLLTVLMLAFFSRATLNRKISFSSTNLLKADSVARSAVDIVVGEIREEIRQGSDVKTTVSGATIYQPATPADAVIAPQTGLTPDADGAYTLRKMSAANAKIFSAGRTLGSTVGIDQKSANGRSQTKWFSDGPMLGVNGTLPTWVYLTRQGVDPSPDPGAAPDAADYCIGRFAYTVYDLGGALDANAAGFPTVLRGDTDFLARKGSLAQVDLAGLPGMGDALADGLVSWRNPTTAGSATAYRNYVFDNTQGFTRPLAADRFFLGRQDLLRFAGKNGIPVTALPYLTAFQRSVNRPGFRPDTVSAEDPDPTLLEPDGGALRRFPLGKLRLLAEDPADLSAADLAEIEEYFGLSPDPGNSPTWKKWTYRGGVGTIAPLDGLSRRPDFFEILQAALTEKSLGQNGGGQTNPAAAEGVTLAETGGVEIMAPHQIMRIGANIIDQYDADSYPTTLSFDGFEFYGIEDVPYFSKVLQKPYFPGLHTTALSPPIDPYVMFELWNPHQPPASAVTASPGRFRVRANADAYVTFSWSARIGGTSYSGPAVSAYSGGVPVADADGYPLEFSADAASSTPQLSYREPRVIRDSGQASYRPLLGCNAMAFPPITDQAPKTSPDWRNATHVYASLRFLQTVFVLEYWDGSTWRPYSTFAGNEEAGGVSGLQWGAAINASDVADANGSMFAKSDPRTFRFGAGMKNATATQFMNDVSLNPDGVDRDITQRPPLFTGVPVGVTNQKRYPSRFATNKEADHMYQDRDGVTRPADAWYSVNSSVNPYQTDESKARPVILNRPFRSLGELGYVFRDQPWKTLDFFSDKSGDAALLDYFSLEETTLVGGTVNINSASPTVLELLLSDAAQEEFSPTSALTSPADKADGLRAVVESEPLVSKSALVGRVIGDGGFNVTGDEGDIKTRREASLRALGSVAMTRTWNLLIDVVAQAGRFAPTATSADQFMVEGERRYWMSLAIDRYTGKVVSSKLEPVYE